MISLPAGWKKQPQEKKVQKKWKITPSLRKQNPAYFSSKTDANSEYLERAASSSIQKCAKSYYHMEKAHIEAAQRKTNANSSILQCAYILLGKEYVQTWTVSLCTSKGQRETNLLL